MKVKQRMSNGTPTPTPIPAAAPVDMELELSEGCGGSELDWLAEALEGDSSVRPSALVMAGPALIKVPDGVRNWCSVPQSEA